MNWQSLVIIGIIVILFVILMIINASTNELDKEDNYSARDENTCTGKCTLHHKHCPKHKKKEKIIPDVRPIKKVEPKKIPPQQIESKKVEAKKIINHKKAVQPVKSAPVAKAPIKKTKSTPPKKKK